MDSPDKVEQLRQSLQAKKEAEAASSAPELEPAAAPAPESEALKVQLATLQKELASAQAKAKTAEEDYLRAHAEMQNNQRRLQKEKQDFIKYGNENLLKELLPVLDSLEKALEATQEEGLVLVQRQFLSALEKFGLKTMVAKAEKFDPNYHEAVSQVPVEGGVSSTVYEVFRTGYLYHDRVLRAAMVSVVA